MIYDATKPFSVTLYFDAIRSGGVFWGKKGTPLQLKGGSRASGRVITLYSL